MGSQNQASPVAFGKSPCSLWAALCLPSGPHLMEEMVGWGGGCLCWGCSRDTGVAGRVISQTRLPDEKRISDQEVGCRGAGR